MPLRLAFSLSPFPKLMYSFYIENHRRNTVHTYYLSKIGIFSDSNRDAQCLELSSGKMSVSSGN
jgi:hypothetical protein